MRLVFARIAWRFVPNIDFNLRLIFLKHYGYVSRLKIALVSAHVKLFSLKPRSHGSSVDVHPPVTID